MSAQRKLGQTIPGPVKVLPELAFDMLEGKPVPAGLGKTHMPVKVLQPLSFDMQSADMQSAQETPILQLTIAFHPNATAAQIGRDCHQLHVVLSGKGLLPIDCPNDLASGNGDVRLAFQPLDMAHARERIEPMIAAIEAAVRDLQSIRTCEARLAA
jgi:hypothetical protein